MCGCALVKQFALPQGLPVTKYCNLNYTSLTLEEWPIVVRGMTGCRVQEVSWICREEAKACPSYVHKRLDALLSTLRQVDALMPGSPARRAKSMFSPASSPLSRTGLA